MGRPDTMDFQHVETGVCGLSCRLCPRFNSESESRCGGCKSPHRMGASCPFVTCAVRKKGIELCTDCSESGSCERLHGHLEAAKEHDSFVCYQKLADNVAFIKEHGIEAFEDAQAERGRLLARMIAGFDDGRSKSFYCVAATVLEVPELEAALAEADNVAASMPRKDRAKWMRAGLEEIARRRGYALKLRK